MKKLEFCSLILISGFFIGGCKPHDYDQLKRDKIKLQKEINVLQDKIDNSIVIPQDEIKDYIYPMTISDPIGRTKKEFQFTTILVLGNLPNNIKWKWNSSPDPMKLAKENLKHVVTSFYENPGLKNYMGSYILTFPNKKENTFYWSREFEIVN